ILALALALATTAAVPPVRTMYNDALAREQAVRAALDAPDALATILIDVRTVVAAYEAVVKHYPASSYSDDALWNAGRLSIDAFVKFGQAQDKDAATRLLNRLKTTYPSSKFVKQMPEQLARVQDDGARDVPPAEGSARLQPSGTAQSSSPAPAKA